MELITSTLQQVCINTFCQRSVYLTMGHNTCTLGFGPVILSSGLLIPNDFCIIM
jgi:hypothetical protein